MMRGMAGMSRRKALVYLANVGVNLNYGASYLDKYNKYRDWNIVCMGDSMTSEGVPSWPKAIYNILDVNGNTCSTHEFHTNDYSGVHTFWDILENHSAELVDTAYYNSNYHMNILLLRHYLNKEYGGLPIEAMLPLMQQWYIDRKAAGWTVVSSTYMPFSLGYTGQEDSEADNTKRNAVNAEYVAHPELYADIMVYIHEDPYIGLRHCETNTTYFNADRLHPTGANNLIQATYTKSAIDAYMSQVPPVEKLVGNDADLAWDGATGSPTTPVWTPFTAVKTGIPIEGRLVLTGSCNAKVAIYSDKSNMPHALLASANSIAGSAGINILPLNDEVLLFAGTQYWLCAQIDDTSKMSRIAGANTTRYGANGYATAFPALDPNPGGITTSSVAISMWGSPM